MPKGLPHGAYDHPLTRALARATGEIEAPTQIADDLVTSTEVAAIVGRHLAVEIARVIATGRALPGGLRPMPVAISPPLWDGDAATRIVEVFERTFAQQLIAS